MSSALFGHDGVLGKMRAQPRDNGLLRTAVGLRHQVDFALVADLRRPAEFRKQNVARLARGLHGQSNKRVHE